MKTNLKEHRNYTYCTNYYNNCTCYLSCCVPLVQYNNSNIVNYAVNGATIMLQKLQEKMKF